MLPLEFFHIKYILFNNNKSNLLLLLLLSIVCCFLPGESHSFDGRADKRTGESNSLDFSRRAKQQSTRKIKPQKVLYPLRQKNRASSFHFISFHLFACLPVAVTVAASTAAAAVTRRRRRLRSGKWACSLADAPQIESAARIRPADFCRCRCRRRLNRTKILREKSKNVRPLRAFVCCSFGCSLAY